jgi:hypothetical protein
VQEFGISGQMAGPVLLSIRRQSLKTVRNVFSWKITRKVSDIL